MNRNLAHRIAVGVLVALAACTEPTSSSGPEAVELPNDRPKSRDQILREEISRLGRDHPWAGVYGNSCGFDGDTLALAPEGGFEWTYFDCINVNRVASGTVTAREGHIELNFTSGSEHPNVRLSGSRFLVVPWGQDRFLLPPEGMPDFANDFNDGSLQLPSYCGVFSKTYRAQPRSGKPSVPSEYASMFLDRPIEAQIVALEGHREERIEGWTYFAARVRLNVGTDHGAFLGMCLRVQDPPLHNAYTIVELGAATSIAQRSRFADAEPRPGWRLSTAY